MSLITNFDILYYTRWLLNELINKLACVCVRACVCARA